MKYLPIGISLPVCLLRCEITTKTVKMEKYTNKCKDVVQCVIVTLNFMKQECKTKIVKT